MMRTVLPKQNRSSAASMNLPKHVLQTRKTIPAAGGGARVVRIFCTDADATDSSCSEEENATENFTHRRKRQMVRYVHEILFEPAASARRNSAPRPWAPSEGKRFRGVRQRRWGRYSAEIRDPSLRKRRWLGTFDTAEEAAAVYDLAAIQLKGDKAVTNFPTARAEPEPPAPAKLPDPGFSGGEPPRPLLSPTSVLRYGEDESPFDDCIIYGDVDAFGFSVLEEHICLPESYLPVPATWMEELGYGEIDNLSPLEVSDL